MRSVRRAWTCRQPAASSVPRSPVSNQAPGGSGASPSVARHQHRPADLDPAVADAQVRAGQRAPGPAVAGRVPRGVRGGDHLRAGLRHPVGEDDRQPAFLRALQQRRRRLGTADQHGAQLRRRHPAGMRVEHAVQHRRHQRRERDAVRGNPVGKRGGVEAGGEHDAASRREAACQDRQPADPRHRHAQQPPVVVLPAEVRRARGGRGDQRCASQHRGPRRSGRARRVQDRGRVRRQRALPPVDGADLRDALGVGEARVDEQRRRAQLEQRIERDRRRQRVAADDDVGLARRDRRGERTDPIPGQRGEYLVGVAAAVRDEADPRSDFTRGGEDRKRVAHGGGKCRRVGRGRPLRRGCQGKRGNLRKSGLRFSRYAFLPSCPSSDR